MRVAHLSFALFFGLTSTIVASAGTIDAALPLDTATSHLALAVTFDGKQIISASIPFTGGSFDAEIAQTGNGPPPLNLTNVTGEVDAGPFTINTLLGNLSAKGLSLALGPDAGPFLTNGLNPAQVNLAGLPISIDEGTINVLGLPLVNFAHTPLDFKLPSTPATLNDTVLSLAVPVNVSGSEAFSILGHGATIGYSLTGSINFAGPVAAIPEPSTLVLGTLGGLALLAYRRRFA
jgi:hypothetical protein